MKTAPFRLCVFVALTAIASALFGQIETTVTAKKALLGVTSPVISGNRILVGADSNVAVSDVILLAVKTDYKFTRVKASRDGQRVEGEKQESGDYLFAGAGSYVVEVTAFDPEKGIDDAEVTFKIGGQPDPVPPGPVPPGPVPPGPQPPTPDVAPIPLPGFRVMIIEETADRPRLPSAQLSILFAPEMKDYLNTKCVVGPDGRTPEWRIMDEDTAFPETCDLAWCKAIKRPRASLPWIIISDGKTGYEGPLPGSLPETMDLLRRFGK
jgi:hypothetical protein